MSVRSSRIEMEKVCRQKLLIKKLNKNTRCYVGMINL